MIRLALIITIILAGLTIGQKLVTTGSAVSADRHQAIERVSAR